MNKYFSFLFLIVSLNVNPSEQKNFNFKATDFLYPCGDVQKFQRLFDGQCNLSPSNIYANLTQLVEFIANSDSKMTIDDLFRKLFNEKTLFFEDKYKKNVDYMKSVKDLKTKFDELGKKLETSSLNVKISEFYDAFLESKAVQFMNEIIKEVEDEYYADFDNNIYEDFFCLTGSGFCDKTRTLFDLVILEDWADLTLDASLTQAFKSSYDNTFQRITNITVRLKLIDEQKNILKFLETLRTKGFKETFVSDLQSFLKNELLKQIIAYYDPNSENVIVTKKTTTVKTTVTTTVKEKVLNIVAVHKSIVITIPVVLVLIGVIVAITFIVIDLKPIINLFFKRTIQPFNTRNDQINMIVNQASNGNEMKSKEIISISKF